MYVGATSVGRQTVCNLIIVDIGSFITYNPIKQGQPYVSLFLTTYTSVPRHK